jgi:Histidine kinase/7TM diverse intracellular signalling
MNLWKLKQYNTSWRLCLGVLWVVLGFSIAHAQSDTIVISEMPTSSLTKGVKMSIYVDSSGVKSFSEVVKLDGFQLFGHASQSAYLNHDIWIRLKIKNNLKDTLYLKAFFGNQNIGEIFKQSSDGRIEKSNPWQHNKNYSFANANFTVPLQLPPQQLTTYWIAINEYIFFDNIVCEISPVQYALAHPKQKDYRNTLLFAYICLVVGMFLFTGIIAAVQSIYSKDRTYGYWAIYLFINGLFFAAELNRAFSFWFFNISKYNPNNIALPWPTAIQFLVSIAYLFFINSFLEIKALNTKIYRFIKVSTLVMSVGFCWALFAVVFYQFGYTIYADMFLVVTNLLILMTVIMIMRSDIPQKNMLMLGSLGVLLAATLSVSVEIMNTQKQVSFWLIPIVCYGLGAIWELACFSLALSQRTKLIQFEAQQIQKNYTIKLENELTERLDIIHKQDKQLEQQRINTLTTEFEQKIAETEITALRSQMNPHFIFNCLNSIKLYSLENDSESASVYLTKFSKLIRLVLDNSRSERLTLEKEIETLRLYIEMEIMRFKEKVTYEMIISPEIDQQYVEIPPLLIQPYVENAIWHGLMHKEFGGKVSILVNLLAENMLEIQIIDNGVGREKSLEYKSKTATIHKSFGMKVTNERIELINQIYKTAAKVEIIDLYDRKHTGVGTKVIIQIPI